jgi:hypothetical protein
VQRRSTRASHHGPPRPAAPAFAFAGALALVVAAAGVSAQTLTGGPLPARLEAVAEACAAGDAARVRLALGDLAPAVRQLAVACIAAEERGDIEVLAAVAGDADRGVRLAVARRLAALGDAGGAAGSAALAALAADPDAAVRAAAWRAAPLPRAPEALAALLADPDRRVVEAVAARIAAAYPGGPPTAWTDVTVARFGAALSRQATRERAPEAAAALDAAAALIEGQRRRLPAAGPGAPCASDARAQFDALDAHLEAAWEAERGGLEAAESARSDAAAAWSAYEACRAATPLGDGAGSGAFGADWVATPVVRADWVSEFGLLRADAAGLSSGGELRAEVGTSLFLYVPGAYEGEDYPDGPGQLTFAAGGRVSHESYYRNDELTGLYGAGLLAVNLPLTCLGAACDVGARLFGRHEPGRDEADFPARLVAPHDRLGGAGHWLVDAPAGRYALRAGYERVRYAQGSLDAAGTDRLHAAAEADGRFQLRLGATRTGYARAGASGNAGTVAGREDRDNTVLSALSGVRLGGGDDGRGGGGVRFEVLAGAALPFVDGDGFAVDPEVIFDMSLLLEAVARPELEVTLVLGGARRLEASPRNFALQAVVEALLRLSVRAGRGSPTDVAWEVESFYHLVDHEGPLTDDGTLRINGVGGEMRLEVAFLEWFGVGMGDRLEAVGVAGADLVLGNTFSVWVFVPLSGSGLDPEVAWPEVGGPGEVAP